VYAAEWPESPDGHVRNLVLPDASALSSEFRPDLLGGVQVVKARALALDREADGSVWNRPRDLLAIPYYTWANRGPGEMLVWLPRDEASARPQPYPTLASRSKVTVSAGRGARALNDQADPASSRDESNTAFSFWPRKGTTEWVEYAFPATSRVSEVEVYWFDDTGEGETALPLAWRVLSRDGEGWKPVEAQGPYSVVKDAFSRVAFAPVETSGLRLEVTLRPELSAGLLEWRVH
jgi:uncharacterized protein